MSSKNKKLKKLQAQRIRAEAALKAKKRLQRKQVVYSSIARDAKLGHSIDQSGKEGANVLSGSSKIASEAEAVIEKPVKKPRVSLAEFVRQVRKEAIRRVTWPKRQEVLLGTVMVLIAASIVAVFFLVLDSIFSWLVRLVF